jgi:hypothetical protein
MVSNGKNINGTILHEPRNLTSYLLMLTVFAVSFLFAIYTNHAWEDWFITYRASKNLAMGNGLVFAVGERVHSFTSPLGTLVPALLSFVSGSRSDALVLWLFRAVNCSLLGLSAIMLLRITRHLQMLFVPTVLLIGLFAVDAKIIDFSINGMESAFMMAFLTATLYVMSVPTERASLKLGLAWAGLMWTRPDSFVYIGGLAASYLLFNPGMPNVRNRTELLKMFGMAGLITTAVYLPWILWTWYYYGTPVPHTIVAKGLLSAKIGSGLIGQFLTFPYKTVFGATSVVTTFLPPNYIFGGWPGRLVDVYSILALLCTYYWCLPFGRPLGRALSFTCFLAHFYLTSIATSFYPWYLPSVTLLSILVLGLMTQQAIAACYLRDNMVSRYGKQLLSLCAAAALLVSLLMTMATGHQMKLQQEIIEDGNRKQIGLWLKEHAASRKDTVFLECLGYIGFYSQLKMLDFPGLSSPEVVAVRRRLNTNEFAPLITALQPDWLVLRPVEIDVIMESSPALLTTEYRMVKSFDVSDRINAHRLILGRPYLQNDQTFVVFRNQKELLLK